MHSLKLPDLGIFIIWDYQIVADTEQLEELDVTDPKSSDSDSSDGHSSDEEAPLPSDQSLFSHSSDHSETTDSDTSRCDTRSPVIEHTITFKCIGTTKSGEYQNILSKAKKELSLNLPVPVRLMPEPNNPMDNKAIAFECCMQGKWMRVGYVIRELTEEVHEALSKNEIVNVQFEWIRYMFKGFASGPGFYAGIQVTRNGKWSTLAMAKASYI